MDHLGYEMDKSNNPVAYNNYNNGYSVNNCKVSLKNDELWKNFHNLQTEMIITKSGRRMFPSLQVQVDEIDPQAFYCIFLEMVPASRCRYKYSSSGGWASAGSEEAQSLHRIYLHPESPAKGEYWMSQPINFGRLKLTNMPAPPSGQIVLSSMHKYQPRIIIAQTSDPGAIAWLPSTYTYVEFKETQFIAVTAYQNEKITQLKIDNNPFAKGFRQNGQAKCKRKRVCMEEKEEDELICVTDNQDELEENNLLNKSTSGSSIENLELSSRQSTSPRSRLSSESDKPSVCPSPVSSHGGSTIKCAKYGDSFDVSSRRNLQTLEALPNSTTESFQNMFYPYHANSQLYLPSSTYYPYFPISYPPPTFGTPYYYPYGSYYGNNIKELSQTSPLYLQRATHEMIVKKPKKLTDFSIQSIMGC